MSTYDFYFFRIKITISDQMNLFGKNLSRSEIIKQLIRAKPTSELYKGNYWHIGNIKELDDEGGYFALGKTTQSILEKYDSETGNFIEELDETSPYTHVIYDSEIGFFAIAQKTKLSPTIVGIANKLRGLFQSTDIAFSNGLTINIDPISDPKDFIEAIQTAYSIRSFTFTFTRPNPIDVDELFQKPMEKYLEIANGKEGSTTVKGENLDSDPLVELSKSVATSGNDARARLKPTQKDRLIRKSLKSNPAHFGISDEEFTADYALKQGRKLYRNLRGKDGNLG